MDCEPRRDLTGHSPGDARQFLAGYLDPAELTDSGRRAVAVLDRERARFVAGEQTNTSVIVPGRPPASGIIVKRLREPAPGTHPDVEVPGALWRAGWRRVPEPLGVTRGPGGDVVAIIAAFLDGAEDGFELACRLAREGQAFAAIGELGGTVREMHEALRRAFGTTPAPAPAPAADADAARLAGWLRRRAEWAASQVSELGEYRAAIGQLLDQVAGLPGLPQPQRIHGDLHLGQTLHRRDGWYVLDFEGEPLVPLAERRAPGHPERDVAGIVRSIDYASAMGGAPGAWRERTTAAFLSGYGQGAGPANDLLLRAFTLDKALYECVYERANRPAWLPIPLAAVRRITDAPDGPAQGAD